jgi:hypothetical protein
MLLKVEPMTLRVPLPLGPMHTSQGTAGTRSPRRAPLRGASAVRSRRTGAAVRGYSTGYSAVRAHRDAREGRADDADVAGAVAVDTHDTHEPAVIAGLHNTHRAKLAAAPAQRLASGTPLRCECYAQRR